MTLTLDVVLLVIALVCFLLAAIRTSTAIDLTAAGLACWVASLLF